MEPKQLETMKEVAKLIQDGAMAFLRTEYKVMAVFIVLFTGLLLGLTNVPTAGAFVAGAVTSIACGWIGMSIAVKTNVKTTHESYKSLGDGFYVALEGGCVMGLSLVSIGVLGLLGVIVIFKKLEFTESPVIMYECLAGYGLGGSAIALFGRVGGGIYTKAADVGADLSGKDKWGLNEDDYRNPACIADNVGDNVGDIAGMGADLFGSFAESTCAALVIAASAVPRNEHESLSEAGWDAVLFPLTISALGVVVGWLTLILAKFQRVK